MHLPEYLTWRHIPMREQDAPRQQAIQKELLLNGFADGRVDAFEGVPMVSACTNSIGTTMH